MLHQRLEHGELTGGEHVHLITLLQLTGGQGQFVLAETYAFILGAWRSRYDRSLAAQHGLDPRQQLARIERLGQVIVSAQFQTLNAAGLIALGGEHDDRHLIVGFAQAAAGRQPVLAWQHQVEHHQVEQLARQQTVHLLDVLHRSHAVALLVKEALKQAA